MLIERTRVSRAMLSPLTRDLQVRILQDLESVPHPVDEPQGFSQGEPIDRVMLIGGGPALGIGVATQGLALPGSLARELSRRTGRGSYVQLTADARMTPASAARITAQMDLSSVNAVIFTLGYEDAMSLTPSDSWARELTALVRGVLSRLPLAGQVFLVETSAPGAVLHRKGPIVSVVDRHTARLNAVTKEVCRVEQRVSFVSNFAPLAAGPSRYFQSPADFLTLAVKIANVVAPRITARPASAQDAAERESERQKAVDETGIVHTPPSESLDVIVGLAQRVFRTSSAALSIIDGQREWHKARTPDVGDEVPRSSSFCSITIEGWDAFVVPDAREDVRFRSNPQVIDGHKIRFYAGYPIFTPSGHAIGALCVFDPAPRHDAEVDRGVLKELALLAQQEVWRQMGGGPSESAPGVAPAAAVPVDELASKPRNGADRANA